MAEVEAQIAETQEKNRNASTERERNRRGPAF